MSRFKIDADNFEWIDGEKDNTEDYCLHGDAVALIGDERFEYHCTVSATALYLLKTLTENHIIDEDNQMLPCCGFYIIPNDTLSNVTIGGCNDGIDWTVLHQGDSVLLITESGKETLIPLREYEQEVFRFADKVEAYYKSCSAKELPEEGFDRDGYIAFWNEWKQRRRN